MLEDLEHYQNRLQETLHHITSLDYSIHGSLNDVEYATDIEGCEVYINSAKRALYKATRTIDFNPIVGGGKHASYLKEVVPAAEGSIHPTSDL